MIEINQKISIFIQYLKLRDGVLTPKNMDINDELSVFGCNAEKVG